MVAIGAWLARIFVWSMIFRIFRKVISWFLMITIGLVFIFKYFPVPVTLFMLQRCVAQKADDHPMVLKKEWVSLSNISDYAQISVVCAEDQKFLSHNGFDFEAIKKAYAYNELMEEKGKVKKKGASTISQQTAKNVFLWHGRSWIRKGFETYFTFLIELIWSKQRILEVYLNVIEQGDGIYGVEASAQHFFKKSAKDITASQAALMAVVLPNPRKFLINVPSAYVKKRQSWCLRQMKNNGMKLNFDLEKISEEEQGNE